MAPNLQISDVSNSDMPKRSCKVLPLSERVCMSKLKHSIYRVWYYLQFQASSEGLGNYPPRITGEHCIVTKMYGMCARRKPMEECC